MKMCKLKSYEDMKKNTIRFYNDVFQINTEGNNHELAIQSLVMPEYMKEFNESKMKPETRIYNNGSLATLGDTVISTFLMNRYFKKEITPEHLSEYKRMATNKELNQLGQKVLISILFYRNNDLYYEESEGDLTQNRKGYASAFEAVVGFLYKCSREKCDNFLADCFK
jgi:23S rRNA maturation mini-RNase III